MAFCQKLMEDTGVMLVRHFSESLFPNQWPFWSSKTCFGSKLVDFAPQILPKHVSALQFRLNEAILTPRCASAQGAGVLGKSSRDMSGLGSAAKQICSSKGWKP